MPKPNSIALSVVLPVLGVLVLFSSPAHAHKIKVFATASTNEISGYVYFPGGGRARDIEVTVKSASGELLATTKTDGEGNFTFAPVVAGDHEFVVETADGHRASYTVKAEELAGLGAPAGPGPKVMPGEAPSQTASAPLLTEPLTTSDHRLAQLVDAAVSKHVRPLREHMDQQEDMRRLHDIIGGIGYIFGIMGIVLFLKSRKKPA